MTGGPLRSIPQAAEWLGVGEHTLGKLVAARRVPHTRIGKHVRFTDDDLQRIADSGHVEPHESAAAVVLRHQSRRVATRT